MRVPKKSTQINSCMRHVNKPGRRQSKTLLTIDECGSKLARNSVFNCHLSPVRQQMAIENSVSVVNDFLSTFADSIYVFDCRLPRCGDSSRTIHQEYCSSRFVKITQRVKVLNAWANPEEGQGVRTPLKNHQNIGFLSNTGPDHLKNHKATKPAFNVEPSSACQRNAI